MSTDYETFHFATFQLIKQINMQTKTTKEHTALTVNMAAPTYSSREDDDNDKNQF
jgi:hypothetical protein